MHFNIFFTQSFCCCATLHCYEKLLLKTKQPPINLQYKLTQNIIIKFEQTHFIQHSATEPESLTVQNFTRPKLVKPKYGIRIVKVYIKYTLEVNKPRFCRIKLRFITLHNSICGICASWFSDIDFFPQQHQCLGNLPFSFSLGVLNGRTYRGRDTHQFKSCCLPRNKNEIQNSKKGRLIGSMNMSNHFWKKYPSYR